jgi:hypothetical protein
MRLNKLLLAILLLIPLALSGCGGGGGGAPAVPVLLSVVVAPENTTIATGSVQQFTATAIYSNNVSVDVTGNATWSSSAPAVATVSDSTGSKGSASGVSAGSATITASYGGRSSSATLDVTGTGVTPVAANVMTISVNGSLCSPVTSLNYFNKPCVSVKVCVPGDPSNCQTVNDILLDTGSFGLRIFQQSPSNAMGLPAAFTALLPQVSAGSGSLVGCVDFADGSSLWGPIKRATVILGNEPGVTVPIQVVNPGFAPATNCGTPDETPIQAGFTGILGVGLFQQDCGPNCANSAANGKYYSCTGSNCTGTSVPLADQVQNPVPALPQDNNGVIVQLPFVPPGGASSVTGSLILGIGTQTDNAPGSPAVLHTNAVGDFTTVFNGVTFSDSFLDTGSNGNFIPNLAPNILPPCSGANAEWYCPPSTAQLFATLIGFGGTPSTPVVFKVSNALMLFASSDSAFNNNVFSDLAGTSSFGFDWGMPFHMGRKVFYGFEGKRTPALGATGPFVGF